MRQILYPVVVGRQEELDLLQSALAGAREGRGGLVLIRGEAGVGKSRLTLQLEATARSAGMRVLLGRAASGVAVAHPPGRAAQCAGPGARAPLGRGGGGDGPLGPVPPTGRRFTLPLCEMWHFDSSGRVVGGDLYYDQVSLLTQLGLMLQPSSP